MDEDTPRSYTSPRDDRFFTPRTIARSNSASNSDEWISPRHEGDFQTPRSYIDSERKDRTNVGYGAGSKDYYYAENHYTQQSKAYYTNSALPNYDSKPAYGAYTYSNPPATHAVHSAPSKSVPYANNNNYPPQVSATTTSGKNRQYIAEEGEEHYHVYDDQQDAVPAGFMNYDLEEIFSFARHGRCEEIEKLLDQGLPVDTRDEYGNTLLIIACQNGNKRVAKAVLRRGANINARNYKGNTPLHYCHHCKSIISSSYLSGIILT
jgi:hypothetical protein